MDYFPMRKEYPLEDQKRTDKDDEMFGRTELKLCHNEKSKDKKGFSMIWIMIRKMKLTVRF